MAIVAQCPHCGKRFKADEKLAGKKAKCSGCAHFFVIEIGAGQATVMVSKGPAPAAARVLAPEPLETPALPIPEDLPQEKTPDIALNIDRAPAKKAAPEVTDIGHPRRKSRIPLIAAVVALVIAGGAAAVWGPKLLSRLQAGARWSSAKTNVGRNDADSPNPGVRTVSHVLSGVPAGLNLPTPAAWDAKPDQAAKALSLADDLRLAIPADPSLRFSAAATVMAAPPSPFAAVVAAPEGDRAATTLVEIWNLSTKARSARFKLARPLTFAILSPDGAYYAGQAYDQAGKVAHVEIWSAASGQLAHTILVPASTLPNRAIVLGFPAADQVAVFASGKLQLYDLKIKGLVRELVAQTGSDDPCIGTSVGLKLVALADAKALTLIDFASSKRIGSVMLPDALVSHPRRALSPRAVEFSPDGKHLAVLFDNRSSARRIAVVEVATGRIVEFLAPAAPVYSGGPELRWLPDGAALLVGSGVLLDRASGRQIGQIYGDLANEGLGGELISLVGGVAPTPRSPGYGRALIAWDKGAAGLVLRAVQVRRENPDWVNVAIASASTAIYDHLQCVSRQFGNAFGFQSMSQIGRLVDPESSKFLVVNVEFSAMLSEDAPDLLPFRPDQFSLVADGQPRPPIGTLAGDGSFTLEPPEYDLRKRDKTPRRRAIVFAVSGNEQSLAIRIANKEKTLGVPASVSQPPTPALTGIAAERLPESALTAPDDSSQITARVLGARLGPYTIEPDAAEHLPLAVTYEPPRGAGLLTVQFELTATAPRTYSRVNRTGTPPKIGLLLPDGTHLRPVIELPGLLPIMLSTGERRTHTCLFLLRSSPSSCRLTYENSPVATVKPEPATARSSP
jgi:hypothetical protein